MSLNLGAVASRIDFAVEQANLDVVNFRSTLGTLSELRVLFPSVSAPTLGMLARLSIPTKSIKPVPVLKVTLGVGHEFAEACNLYNFFNSMLVFESEDAFAGFVKHGYTVAITAGKHDEIVAAAAFVAAPDGIFVDAMAVSHGTHPNAFILSKSNVEKVVKDKDQLKSLTASNGADFQGLGLGCLITELLCHLATSLCTKNLFGVYLKAHTSTQPFYFNRGFSPAILVGDDINLIVPASHLECGDETMIMVKQIERSNPSDEPVVPEVAAAAQAIVGLSSIPSPSRPATRTNPQGLAIGRDTSAELSTPPSEDEESGDEDGSQLQKAPRVDPQGKAKGQEASSESSAPSSEESDDGHKSQSKSKAISSKERKRLRAAAQKVDTLTIASSDEEDAVADYFNLPPGPGPFNNWDLPCHDYWQPQDVAYAEFKAKEPVGSHLLTHKELKSKYGALESKALGRAKVIKYARAYQDDTLYMKNRSTLFKKNGFQAKFTDQEYLDFAALVDPNRTLVVNRETYNAATNMVGVKVSSYILPTNMTLVKLLTSRKSRTALKKEVREVVVLVPWLLHTARRDVAEFIQDVLQGTKVQRIHGLNAATDAISLSFSAKEEVDTRFVPLPQGHVVTRFIPTAPPSIPWTRPKKKSHVRNTRAHPEPGVTAIGPTAYYDNRGHATAALHRVMKQHATEMKIPFSKPPPKVNTQVVKLKWVPAKGTDLEPPNDGLWHGVYAVPLMTTDSTTVLQECGLLTDWVESNFAAPFRAECKLVAGRKHSKRNPQKYLFIPAGDAHDTCADPPPGSEQLLYATTHYLQGEEDTCLRDSMASALASMGFGVEAKILAADSSLIGCTLELVERAAHVVRKSLFRKANLVLRKLHKHACSIEDIETEDSAWPIVLILQTSDGCHGSHAITTWNKMIFDSNSGHPLRWSKLSLDWCSGQDSTCIGFSRAYSIRPGNYGDALPKSAARVGLFLESGSNKLGWISGLPGKKYKNFRVRSTTGDTQYMSEERVLSCVAPCSKVGNQTGSSAGY
jgi:hypothetical protein